MAASLDALAEFERFQEEILPILQTALKEGWTAEKIYSHPKAQALLAARQLTIGIMNPDPGKALAAIQDVMNRTIGKPTDKVEVKGKLEKMSDDELDALLAAKLADGAPADDQLN
jgi:hypothetical protein